MKRRKPVDERKENVLRIRLTEGQRKLLDVAAKSRGLPTSSWVLSVGLAAAQAEGMRIMKRMVTK